MPERFFCWRPHDSHTFYEIKVEIHKKTLTEQEINNRCHYQSKGWEPRSIHNIFSIITQYESTYGQHDFAKITIDYSEDGKPIKTWNLKKLKNN